MLEIFTWTNILKEHNALKVNAFLGGFYLHFFVGFGIFLGFTMLATSLGIFMVRR
jgi:hypothetical protein